MSKFNPDDIIRCVSPGEANAGVLTLRKHYRVLQLNLGNGEDTVTVVNDLGRAEWFMESRFELVEAAPQAFQTEYKAEFIPEVFVLQKHDKIKVTGFASDGDCYIDFETRVLKATDSRVSFLAKPNRVPTSVHPRQVSFVSRPEMKTVRKQVKLWVNVNETDTTRTQSFAYNDPKLAERRCPKTHRTVYVEGWFEVKEPVIEDTRTVDNDDQDFLYSV